MSKKYQLPNGLTVILNESHKSPVVSVQMWVRTGSADEQKGEEGISHFIEHLVFKGTKSFGVGEIAATVEGSGGELNAYTSFDQTVFYVTISKNFQDVAFQVVSEMMGFPTFDADEIDNEREVVIEEIKRGQDSFGRQASQLLFSEAYKGHPYSIPVIGYDKVVNKVSKKKMVDYFQTRYVPKNMFLVVSGDFDSKEVKGKIKEYFGGFEPHKLKKIKRKAEKPQEKPRLKVQKSTFEESSYYIAWKIPKVHHKDIPALDILALALGQGDSSRLAKKMRLEKPVVNSVYASTFTPLEKGVFICAAVGNWEKMDESLGLMREELRKVIHEPISADELNKAMTNIESEEFYGMETVDGLSRKTGHLEFLMKDPNYFPKYMKTLYAVTQEDVLRVARKYLKMENLTMTMVLSKDADEDAVKKTARKWLKDFEKMISAKKPKVEKAKKLRRKKMSFKASNSGTGEIEVFDLGGKAKVMFRPSYEAPTLSLRTAHLGGVRCEAEDQGGITELLSRTWVSGTENRTEEEIHLDLENWASSLSAFGGRNTVGLNLDGLSSFEGELSDLYSDVLTGPVWQSDVIDREKHVMKESLKNRDDNPAQKTILKFMENIFAGHPYSRDLKGTKESIDRLGSSDLQSHWSKVAKQSNMLTVVSGFIDVDMWKEKLKTAWNKLDTGEYSDSMNQVNDLSENKSIYQVLEKEQSHIVTGVRGLTFLDEDRYTLEAIHSILSGQGGRLFMELRDKASLAYTVAPLKMEGIDTGYFGAYIGCSPEKGKQALSMLKDEFDKLASTTVSADELDRSKRYLIGRHDIDLQRNAAVANGILFSEVYGIDHRSVFDYAEKINAVTPEKVRSLAERLFSQHSVSVATGNQNPF